MVSHISSSYVASKAYVRPTQSHEDELDTEHIPKLASNQFQKLQELYDEANIEECPVLKVDNQHFHVVEGTDIPDDTLRLPEELIEQTRYGRAEKIRYLAVTPKGLQKLQVVFNF